MRDLLSPTAISCLYTMGIAEVKDHRQRVPELPCLRPVDVRLARARLVLEEAMETVQALGFSLLNQNDMKPHFGFDDIHFQPTHEPNLHEIIDGCCDTIYVAVGTLVAFGVPDLPHLAEVNRCNDAKFPGGVAITDEHGKYRKPPGWCGPDHGRVIREVDVQSTSVRDVQRRIIEEKAGAKTNA